jgi:hypothetical protein
MKVRRISLFLLICSLVVMLTSCGSNNGNSSTNVKVNTSQNSGADVIFSVAWQSLDKGHYDVHIICGFPGIINTANNPKATYNQIEAFLAKAVSYTKSIPKSDNYAENAGYIGPPYITFSNKLHTVTISPAWYVKVTNNYINVKYVTGVLQVTFDKHSILIQSQSFYNWLKENKWQTSFHD